MNDNDKVLELIKQLQKATGLSMQEISALAERQKEIEKAIGLSMQEISALAERHNLISKIDKIKKAIGADSFLFMQNESQDLTVIIKFIKENREVIERSLLFNDEFQHNIFGEDIDAIKNTIEERLLIPRDNNEKYEIEKKRNVLLKVFIASLILHIYKLILPGDASTPARPDSGGINW